MAEYRNDKLGARFEVADTLSVRKQLAYDAACQFSEQSLGFERAWHAAVPLLDHWQCDALPEPKTLDLDTVTDPLVTAVIEWAAGQVANHISRLKIVPKVSSPASAPS